MRNLSNIIKTFALSSLVILSSQFSKETFAFNTTPYSHQSFFQDDSLTLTFDREENIRTIINKEIKEKFGCYLFGNYLDKIVSEIISSPEDYVEVLIPEFFLKKQMNFFLEVDMNKLELFLYHKDPKGKILLLNTLVGLGGKNIDYSTGEYRDFNTPKGSFFLKRVIKNPSYFPPKWSKTKEIIKPGKNNPYGLWMSELSTNSLLENYAWGISGDTQIRIHSTNNSNSIGQNSSHGCIRLFPRVAGELFPAILHYYPHKGPKKNGRGTIYPLKESIPIVIR